MDVTPPNYCYILQSTSLPRRTYNGYTNNLKRRIRQHCSEIKGGARATTRNGGQWEYIAQITCCTPDPAFTKQMALSLEWYIRYPTLRRPRPGQYNTPEGRILGLNLVFALEKFQQFAFTVAILPEFQHLLNPRPNITLIDIVR